MHEKLHTYLHQFRSGNQAAIAFPLPKPGQPSRFDIEWLKPPSWADIAEHRTEWRQVILRDLEALDGRTDHNMIDDTEMREPAGAP